MLLPQHTFARCQQHRRSTRGKGYLRQVCGSVIGETPRLSVWKHDALQHYGREFEGRGRGEAANFNVDGEIDNNKTCRCLVPPEGAGTFQAYAVATGKAPVGQLDKITGNPPVDWAEPELLFLGYQSIQSSWL